MLDKKKNRQWGQVSLFPVGGGQHYIRIKASVRKLTNTREGDKVRLDFVVVDPGDVEIPDDLLEMLETEGLVDAFMDIPPGKRNFIIRRIKEVVKPATRDKRVSEGLSAAYERQSKMLDQGSKD